MTARRALSLALGLAVYATGYVLVRVAGRLLRTRAAQPVIEAMEEARRG